MRRYFDLVIVVPLEEEFEVVLQHFQFVEDLSTNAHIRFAVTLADQPLRILLTKQSAMGKTACQTAANECLNEFDIGALVCIGIAGALSRDVSIGDVCHSGDICDVLDNAKMEESPASKTDISLSPTWYSSPLDLTIPITLDRLSPLTKSGYIVWADEAEQLGKQLIPGEFAGRDGREKIGRPKVRAGTIACGHVSGSPAYNEKLRAIDRKVLAIETESGGLFSAALQRGIPAITIRGISDYAGIDKNVFERETGGNARKFAIVSAATFLVRVLRSNGFISYLDKLSVKRANDEAQLPLQPAASQENTSAGILIKQSEEISSKLRDLAPGYALVSQGYRLPVPRIRIVDNRSGIPDQRKSKPIEVRDALRDTRVITLHVPREYPDLSLSWILASDLLSAQLGDNQLVPSVIEAEVLRRPRFGVAQLVDPEVLRLAESSEFTSVFIIDDFNFGSKSRCDFLREQIDGWPNAKFIIVSRNREDIYLGADFTRNVASSMARLCNISFMEISTFIQKQFEMLPSASEVVALRLRDTFHKYALPAHPSYFAGIPRSTLNAILQANRRAELIEIAVAGYLSFVVAEDKEPVALSRTTREKFLTELVFSIRAEGATFTESQLTAFADVFAKKFDFRISPARFVSAFIEKNILHIEGSQVCFTLTFMEAYLLAKRLTENPSEATKYFSLSSGAFDHRTFAIYAEMGASPEIVKQLLESLDTAIASLRHDHSTPAILLSTSISAALLDHPDRLQSIQTRLQKAEEDVRNDRDQSKEKQSLLDVSDRIRENMAARASASHTTYDAFGGKIPDVTNEAQVTWEVAVSILGSGAERLKAEIKRDLVRKVITLSALIIDRWMRACLSLDFVEIKKDLLAKDDMISQIAKSKSQAHLEEARTVAGIIVDLLEYLYKVQPIAGATTYICEEARDIVLAESIANTTVEPGIEELLRNLWLSDIDAPRGKKPLTDTIKKLPKAKFLRHAIAAQLMSRVFWSHWRKDDKLSMLDVADESLKGVGIRRKTGQLQRLIEKLPDREESDE